MMHKLLLTTSLSCLLLSSINYANPSLLIKDPKPHFYIQMENQSTQDVTLSSQVDQGEVQFSPMLSDGTLLPANQTSQSYGVIYPNFGKDDVFSILFTGKKSCEYKVEFFAPGDPKITIQGLGCAGGGYKLDGHTLILYVSDIH